MSDAGTEQAYTENEHQELMRQVAEKMKERAPIPDDPTDDPRYRLAQRMRETNVKVKEIQIAVGIGQNTYYDWFPAQDREPMRKAMRERNVEMLRLREAGWSDAAIGREFGISRQNVGLLLGRRGNSTTKTKVVFWRTTEELLFQVNKVARAACASFDGREASIQTMLEMIGRGQLTVTAPNDPRFARER